MKHHGGGCGSSPGVAACKIPDAKTERLGGMFVCGLMNSTFYKQIIKYHISYLIHVHPTPLTAAGFLSNCKGNLGSALCLRKKIQSKEHTLHPW